jgi:hypothetical protein
MTRRHFIALAAALRAARPFPDGDTPAVLLAELRGWRHAVEATATACAESNPNFDRSRFLRAAGLEG